MSRNEWEANAIATRYGWRDGVNGQLLRQWRRERDARLAADFERESGK